MVATLEAKKIAKRYVISLFSGFTKDTDISKAEKDINDLGAMVNVSDDLRVFITSPLLSKQQQSEGIAALAKKAKLTESVSNFLQLLVENRRLHLLPAIVAETESYLADQSGIVPVQVATARKLTAADQKKIQSDIKATLGQNVIMQTYIDESLIGGVVVQIGSTLIDGSIKHKLDKLERDLVKSGAA